MPAATRTFAVPVTGFTALLLAACATTKMDAQWSNPEFAKASLRGQTVLVACQARDFTTQAVCEDQAASQLESRGAKAVKFAVVKPGAPPSNDAVEAAAKQAGARAIFRSSLSTFAPAVSSGPTIGIGVGGYGGSGGWGGGGYRGGSVGGGITLPIGGGTVSEAWAAETVLVDVATGTLMWSGRATTPTGSDITAQLADLSRVTVDALASNGTF
jgi:hypothetical protein